MKKKSAESSPKSEPREGKASGGEPPRLKSFYHQEVVPRMLKEFSYRNPMQVPRLQRIVINVGMGEAIQNVKLLESAVTELATITGQKPVMTRAKKAIAGFKVRQGMPIGAKVTLRSHRMYEFFDRLVNIGLPRIRDFRGVSPKAFDGARQLYLGPQGAVNLSRKLNMMIVASIHGMDIVLVTSAKRNYEAKSLLAHLGMPFRT